MKIFSFLNSSALLLTFIAYSAQAETAAGNVVNAFGKMGYDWVDVASADFDGSFVIEGGLRFQLDNALSLEIALTGISDSTTDNEEDNTGSYQLTLNSIDLLFGGIYQIGLQPNLALYVRGGGLVYSMEMEIEEAFYDLKPAGSDSTKDNGFGLYAGIGGALKINTDMSLLAEFLYKNRLDFLSSSSRPFDVSSYGLSIGLQHKF